MSEPDTATIHVVDDGASLRKALTRLLRGAGCNVVDYASADDFLAHAPHSGYGCVLLDVMLGGTNGLDIQQALLRGPDSLPVVFMSASCSATSAVNAMRLGAVDFLVKPFDRYTLLRALDAALMLRRRRLSTASRDRMTEPLNG